MLEKLTRKERLERIRKRLAPHGLDVQTWSPGDGKTRYKILPKGQDYCAATESLGAVLMGLRELEQAVRFFLEGMDWAQGGRQRAASAILGLSAAHKADGLFLPAEAVRSALEMLGLRPQLADEGNPPAVLGLLDERIGEEGSWRWYVVGGRYSTKGARPVEGGWFLPKVKQEVG